MKRPSAERIQELLDVDVSSGVIRWRKSQGRAKAGDLAGRLHRTGYWRVTVDCVHIPAHHIVYFVATGDWPPLIDHLNGVRDDNRIENLRLADSATNARNRTNWRHSKLLGAHKSPTSSKWRAVIGDEGINWYLGSFDTEEQAHARYCEARDRIAAAEREARLAVLNEMHGEAPKLKRGRPRKGVFVTHGEAHPC